MLRVRGDGVEPWHVSLALPNWVGFELEDAPTRRRALVVTPSGRAAIVGEPGRVYWAASGDRPWRETVRDLTPREIGVQEMSMDDVAGDDRALYAVGSRGARFARPMPGSTGETCGSLVDHFQVLWAEGEEAMVTGGGLSDSHDGGRTVVATTDRHRAAQDWGTVRDMGCGRRKKILATPEGLLHSSDGGVRITTVPISGVGRRGRTARHRGVG